MNNQREGKPTTMRILLVSIMVSSFLSALFLAGGVLQYGIAKVAKDWRLYVAFFVLAFICLWLGSVLAVKFGGRGK